jgi:hypothetical protein
MPQLQKRRKNVPPRIINERVHFENTRIPGSEDPPETLRTFLLSLKVEANVLIAAGSGTSITGTQLTTILPGGATVWNRFRILKVEAWGADITSTQFTGLNLTLTSRGLTETSVFTDTGTIGAKRAHICVRPSTLYQQQWLSTQPDTSTYINLATIVASGTASVVTGVLHVTFEARTNVGAKPVFAP